MNQEYLKSLHGDAYFFTKYEAEAMYDFYNKFNPGVEGISYEDIQYAGRCYRANLAKK